MSIAAQSLVRKFTCVGLFALLASSGCAKVSGLDDLRIVTETTGGTTESGGTSDTSSSSQPQGGTANAQGGDSSAVGGVTQVGGDTSGTVGGASSGADTSMGGTAAAPAGGSTANTSGAGNPSGGTSNTGGVLGTLDTSQTTGGGTETIGGTSAAGGSSTTGGVPATGDISTSSGMGGTQAPSSGGNSAGTTASGGTITNGGNVSGGGTTAGDTSTGGMSTTDTGMGGASAAGGTLATGGAPTGGAAPIGGSTCTPGNQLGTSSTNYFVMAYPQLQPFYVLNNGWSSSDTTLNQVGTSQSVTGYDTCNPGTIAWQTDFDWSGANNTVKAYPAAILGWHSSQGWQITQTLLPKTISAIASAKCSWTYASSGGASVNVSFDIWVHNTTCSQSSIGSATAASDEIMIWLNSSGGVLPVGSLSQPGLSIDGATWDLWEGNISSWQAHSFVRTTATTSITDLDILAFLNTLNLGSKCLSSIEAGIEVFQGSGTLNSSSYTCSVQ